MCRYFSQKGASWEEMDIVSLFPEEKEVVGPGEKAVVFLPSSQGGITPIRLSFGFPLRDKLVLNARAETAGEKPFFSDSFLHHPCLVPVSRFYETSPEGEELSYAGEGTLLLAAFWRNGQFVLLTAKPSYRSSAHFLRGPIPLKEEDALAYLGEGRAKMDLAKTLQSPFFPEKGAVQQTLF